MRRGVVVVGLVCAITKAAHSQIPENAERTATGKGWECLSGYVERVGRCIAAEGPSDAEIRRILIRQSLASYPGNCPCPYNTDRAGRACGRRSAYSRPGGYSPLCYNSDITAAMVREYRARLIAQSRP